MRYKIIYTIGGEQETDNEDFAKETARNAIGGAVVVDTFEDKPEEKKAKTKE